MATNSPCGTLNETLCKTVRRCVPLSNSLVRSVAASIRSVVVVILLAACARRESAKDTRETTSGAATNGTSAVGDSARVERLTPRPSPTPIPTGDSGRSTADAGDAPRFMIIGTSLTAGYGLDPDDAYPNMLQRKADSARYRVRIVNAGLSGETSAGALRRLDWLLQGRLDGFMIETGANDGLRGLDIDSTRANLRAIVTRLKRGYPNAPIYLAQMEAPPNLGADYTTRFRAMFPRVAAEEGVKLVPFILDGVAAIPKLNQEDHIHPNLEGERIVAANVW